MDIEGYGLLMPFIDDSNSFVHGFECGQIWTLIEQKKPLEKYLIHKSNEKQVRMICDRAYYSCAIETIDDTWSYVTAKINLSKAN